MPTLNWIGKDKVVNHHHEVPFRVLEHKYGFRADDERDTSETKSGNKIIHGDNLDNVLYWHRNPERGRGFCINGFINHYPNFIVRMKSGRIVVIETKGKQLKNDDSKEKLELGKAWARKAGDNYRYFMAFKQDPLDGAVSIERLLQIMESL
ncbi:MAG: hypothetical protein IJ700_02505 [Bacteroidaceae bacterium]|nr:hypothetical protein [Bacteroidaceae bacterium]